LEARQGVLLNRWGAIKQSPYFAISDRLHPSASRNWLRAPDWRALSPANLQRKRAEQRGIP